MRLEGTRNRKTDKKRSDRKHGVPKGLSLNTISTYMRTLKAVYNRLADKKYCLITRSYSIMYTQR